jgi:hypothetical protein
MSAVASNRDGRRLIVAGSLLCFRHEHRQRGTAFHPLRGTQGSSQKPIRLRTFLRLFKPSRFRRDGIPYTDGSAHAEDV